MALIKSMPLTDEPVRLFRPRPEPAVFEPVAEETAFEAVDASAEPEAGAAGAEYEPGPAEAAHATMDAVSPPEPETTWLSYEEYKQRFEAELAALAQEAREQGRAQGRDEGYEEVKAEYAEQFETLARLIASLREALERGIEASSDGTVDIVCEAVIKVLGEALLQRDAVIAAVRQVIRRTKERTRLVVRVSPADWAVLEGNEAALVEGLSAGSVEVVADDRVQVGGCLLETTAGNFDGRLEVQLARLREALVNARAAAPEEETLA